MSLSSPLTVIFIGFVLSCYSVNSQNEWLGNSTFTCQSLTSMLRKSKGIQSALQKQLDSGKTKKPSSEADNFKLKLLELYVRELRTAERTLIDFLHDFNDSLSSEYGVLSRLERNCQDRLNSMRNAAALLEEDYNYIIELEKEMATVLKVNVTLADRPRIIKGIFSEISRAADDLEKKFHGDAFQLSKKLGGALETVVKVADNHENSVKVKDSAGGVHHHSDEDGRSVLIDSLSNQYVLSRPRDITVPVEDVHFLYDLAYLLLLSFLVGTVCCTFKVPTLLGYTIAGMVLGPVGLDQIRSLVQVETVGELGVVFIVFMIGLEFSPEKLKRVWEVSVKGGNLLFVFTILLITLLGLMVDIHPKHTMFFAACIAHSSTTLTFRFLEGAHLMPKQLLVAESETEQLALTREAEPDVAGALIGIIVMQDLQRGLLMSLMPFFAESSVSWAYTLFLLVKLVLGFIALLVLVRMLTTRVLDGLYRLLEVLINKTEAILLCSLAVCFLLLVVANALGAPIELGAFFAGIAIGAQRTQVVEQVRSFVEPLRDFFSIFFFASIGFHVFPTFMSEFSMIFVFTFIIVGLKLLIAVAVLGLYFGHCNTTTWIVGVGLAHVSDFSFVLASRARRMDIISREVYLVILSVSALSILLSPFLWQLVLTCVKSQYWHHLQMSFARLRLHFMKSS